MKTASLIAGAAIVGVANLVAVLHGIGNRGVTEAEVTLTQRELHYYSYPAADENSGITLLLQWTDPNIYPGPGGFENSARWLDQTKLQELGFDCSVSPSSPQALRHYQRQRWRQAFVALEYDGPAWRAWLGSYERSQAQQPRMPFNTGPAATSYFSHLVAIDADRDPRQLRSRNPDRTSVIIAPAAVSVRVQQFDARRPAQIVGQIQQMPREIHVPRPFSDQFRARQQRSDLTYRVHVRYGASLEPWVTGVEFTN